MRSDEALAWGIQQGQMDDLSMLVERHHHALIGFLYRLLNGDRHLAEDLAQETFLRVIRNIAQYQYPRPFKPWLYQIATNLARDHYKRADTRLAGTMPDDDLSIAGDVDPLPEDALLLAADVQAAICALRALPNHQREVIILRYDQELSLAEIAEILSIPVGTVKSRLSVALGRLREKLLERET